MKELTTEQLVDIDAAQSAIKTIEDLAQKYDASIWSKEYAAAHAVLLAKIVTAK